MTVYMDKIQLKTNEMDIVDITSEVQASVSKSGINNGMVCVFCPGSTGAITTIEHEPGLMHDLPAALERIAPKGAHYEHEKMWHDGNGHSHVRASIIGPSIVVPVADGRLQLGTWQQIVFVECDVRSRNRILLSHVFGE